MSARGPIRCVKCDQSRTTACAHSACPVAEALRIIAEQDARRGERKRAPYGSVRALVGLGVKRDMRCFEAREA